MSLAAAPLGGKLTTSRDSELKKDKEVRNQEGAAGTIRPRISRQTADTRAHCSKRKKVATSSYTLTNKEGNSIS
ncbi:hypothetical protein EAI_06237 [Harpegnathos saltator]|uniref:Uncharacterized protein n=1 Tax=Harpegnathos saltator TaxID=610380 RepID=E2C196_HARSA|nr:hypothetical protein EAI_06237 [Harpegnathos saltator]